MTYEETLYRERIKALKEELRSLRAEERRRRGSGERRPRTGFEYNAMFEGREARRRSGRYLRIMQSPLTGAVPETSPVAKVQNEN